jgi:pimeloyl-ACP methyl ester carboxylesterase
MSRSNGTGWRSSSTAWRFTSTPRRFSVIAGGKTHWSRPVRHEYSVGMPNSDVVAPESYTLDAALLARPGNVDIQLDLFLDYANNVKLYPKFQEYFRTSKPPLLAIWGKNDLYFIPPGAEAFRRDIPNATVQFLDTGHFALETHLEEIADAMRTFLAANAGQPQSALAHSGGRQRC